MDRLYVRGVLQMEAMGPAKTSTELIGHDEVE